LNSVLAILIGLMSGAAMSVDGMKKTMPCPAPYALVADLDVLEHAPSDMLASGYADLLTKVPAGADWIIADQLGIEAIAPDIWALVQKDLHRWVSDQKNLHDIFMGLAATGYSMQMYRDSRPASGAEHMMSHVWEMEGLNWNGEEISHGFKVGIGTLASVQLMEFVIRTDLEQAKKQAHPTPSREQREKEIANLLSRGCYGDGIPGVAMSKFLTGAEAEARRELIRRNWNPIRMRIREQLLPLSVFIRLLSGAHAPTEYTQIGLDRTQYLHAIRTAQLIRKRYTILDLLYESGLLETAIGTLK